MTATSGPAEREALRISQIRSFIPALVGDSAATGLGSLSPEETEAVFRNAIAKCQGACLWVVDDLPEGLGSQEIYRWFGPENASTLITTRSSEYSALVPEVRLGVLEPNEALQVLVSRRAPSTERELDSARRVVEELGGHALAIDVAGATLRFQSFGELLAALADPTHDELELAAALREELPTGRERSISQTLSRSLDRLGAPGQDLLRTAAMLARDPIPTTFFAATFRAARASSETDARTLTMTALDEALSLSLIEPVDGSSWRIHPLVARTVGLKDTERDKLEMLRRSAVAVLSTILADARDPGSRRLISHARRLSRQPSGLAEAELAHRVGACDFEVGDYESAKLSFAAEHSALSRIVGVNDPLSIAAATRLGEAMKENYDLESSKAVLGGVVSAARETLGDADGLTAVAIGELCSILYLVSETEEAISAGEEATATCTAVFGPEDPRTLKVRRYLARALEAAGDLQGSRSIIEETLETYKRVCGPEDPDSLRAMTLVGKLCYETGEMDRAATVMAEVLATMRSVHGDRHPDTLQAMNNLAATLREKGDLDDARALAEESLAGDREILGPRNLDTIAAMDTLACILRDLGDLEGARTLGEELVPIAIEGLGPDHVETIAEMTNLSDTLRALGETQRARELAEEALTNCAELGSGHPVTLTTKISLALTLHACGDTSAARRLAGDALSVHREIFGPEHNRTVKVRAALGHVLDDDS